MSPVLGAVVYYLYSMRWLISIGAKGREGFPLGEVQGSLSRWLVSPVQLTMEGACTSAAGICMHPQQLVWGALSQPTVEGACAPLAVTCMCSPQVVGCEHDIMTSNGIMKLQGAMDTICPGYASASEHNGIYFWEDFKRIGHAGHNPYFLGSRFQ